MELANVVQCTHSDAVVPARLASREGPGATVYHSAPEAKMNEIVKLHDVKGKNKTYF